MFCSNCGKVINKDNKFCSNCGYENKYFNTSFDEQEPFQDNQSKINSSVNANDIKDSNYFAKHWRGELSLGVSYWINNFLINTVIYVFILYFSKIADFTEHEILHPFLAICIWILIFVYTPWNLVGLWRASNYHIKQYNKYFWANVVKFLVIIGCIQSVAVILENGIPQIKDNLNIILKNDSLSKNEIRILNNGRELEIKGGISFGLTNIVKGYFESYPNIKTVHLNSPGGRVLESHKLYNYLKYKNVDTYTTTGCQSACVNIFLAGKNRYIKNGAEIGLHSPIFPGYSESEKISSINEEKEFFRKLNVPTDFINKIFSTPSSDMWKPSYAELINAKIVTKIIDGNAFAGTDLNSWRDIKQLETDLLMIKIYKAIKMYEPNSFNKILNIYNTAIIDGKPLQEMYNESKLITEEIFNKYLPYSSKEALNDYLDLIIKEYEYLYDKNPILCYNFSKSLINNFNSQNYFSKEIIDFELNTMAKVIESGAIENNSIPKAEEIEEKFSYVLKLSLMEANIKMSLVKKENPTNEEKISICRYMILLFKEIRNLPEEDRIKILRVSFKNM